MPLPLIKDIFSHHSFVPKSDTIIFTAYSKTPKDCIILSYVYCRLFIYLIVHTTVGGSCGGDLSGSNGNFSPVRYDDGKYAHNQNCSWTITVGQGKHVKLTLNNVKTEQNSQCIYDFLEVSFYTYKF